MSSGLSVVGIKCAVLTVGVLSVAVLSVTKPTATQIASTKSQYLAAHGNQWAATVQPVQAWTNGRQTYYNKIKKPNSQQMFSGVLAKYKSRNWKLKKLLKRRGKLRLYGEVEAIWLAGWQADWMAGWLAG